jgi:hypothetical protein
MQRKSMRLRLSIFASVLLLAPLSVLAQDVLPARYANWQKATAQPAGNANTGLDYLAGNTAAALREYGAQSAQQASYSNDRGNLLVTLYRMKDASGAYGAYSFLRASEMRPAGLSAHSSLSRDRALVLVGNLVLDISGKNLYPLRADLKVLVSQVRPNAQEGAYPFLAQYMPTGGMVPRSDRYVMGPIALNHYLPLADDDWLGFANGAEAQLARYRVDGQEEILLLAEYPTPQVASLQVRNLEKRFRLVGDVEELATPGDARPLLYVRKISSLVALVANAQSKAAADSLLQNLRFEASVTWNEPSVTFNEPGWPAIIVGIFVGTGILCLFAIVASLAFGGLRLLVKRLLPGKVFDRSSEVEILQLGLSSKPIEAKDFY